MFVSSFENGDAFSVVTCFVAYGDDYFSTGGKPFLFGAFPIAFLFDLSVCYLLFYVLNLWIGGKDM